MTSSVNLVAAHWALSAQAIDPKTGEKQGEPIRVPKGETRTEYVHATRDILVHEIQPDEEAAPEKATTDEPATDEAQVEDEVDNDDEDD